MPRRGQTILTQIGKQSSSERWMQSIRGRCRRKFGTQDQSILEIWTICYEDQGHMETARTSADRQIHASASTPNSNRCYRSKLLQSTFPQIGTPAGSSASDLMHNDDGMNANGMYVDACCIDGSHNSTHSRRMTPGSHCRSNCYPNCISSCYVSPPHKWQSCGGGAVGWTPSPGYGPPMAKWLGFPRPNQKFIGWCHYSMRERVQDRLAACPNTCTCAPRLIANGGHTGGVGVPWMDLNGMPSTQ